jgi:membrane peptidoglycan carboxypeptidase
VPQILRMRHRRWNKYHDTPGQHWGIGLALVVSLSLVILIFGFIVIYTIATKNLPSLETLPMLLEPPNGLLLQPTRFYDRSGLHEIYVVENPAIQERKYLSMETEGEAPGKNPHIPATLIKSTIAITDPSFWSNPGFSVKGFRENTHNTLAQRLVSELLLWDEPTSIWRAIRERILAAQITTYYGREKVMEWYLNSANYGNLAYGAEAAAQIYFAKSAEQLNLTEAAILAAITQAPALNPLDAPQTAIDRGMIVIDAMEGQALITSDEATAARKTVITFREAAPSQNSLAPDFINLAWEYLSKSIPSDLITRGGFKIITSLDYDLQLQVSCTTRIHLSRIQNQASIEPATQNDESCLAAQLLPTLTLNEGVFLDNLSANVVVFDPKTSEILAMVGEPDFGVANQPIAGHPPGSLLTPFIYLTAFTRGFSPASLVWDIPMDIPGLSMDIIHPEEKFVGPIRLRDALANDYLIPAIQVINQVGSENILQTARQLGLVDLSLEVSAQNRGNCPGCQIILGGGEITLLEAVQAYGVFTNHGILVGQLANTTSTEGLQPLLPVCILNVHDATNRSWLVDSQVKSRPVISNQLAYLMTNILSDEAARWPSLNHPNPLEIGRPAGAKMGVTASEHDVWTVGFTPQLVVGVWMGVPDDAESSVIPPKIASALWHAVIQYTVQGFPAETWAIPPGITTQDVCDPSGMLPTLQCPTIVSEVFLAGQEPTQPDTLYQAYQINRETERLATIFTPPDLIEEHIYLNVPPEAKSWAKSENLETPPETYDLIYTPEIIPDAQIESPQMFAYLKGLVTIQGRAGGAGFESYRLQAGEGLNPTGWIVVQDDSIRPVENGTLGTWDTSNLSGLYALQLIVLRDNQQVDTTTIQVTIDNSPPEVSISNLTNGETFSPGAGKVITLLAEASDNLAIKALEFYLDGNLVATQTQPPFAYPWSMSVGKHVLTVKAIDLAGNTNQASVTFTVE